MPDNLQPIDEVWRERLIEAELQYRDNPKPETKAEYLRTLKIFRNFVFYGKMD